MTHVRRDASVQAAVAAEVDALEFARHIKRIDRPSVKLVCALATQHVVVTRSGIDLVVIGNASIVRPLIAPQAIVAFKAPNPITSATTIDSVAGWRTNQRVISRAAIDRGDKVAAASDQR